MRSRYAVALGFMVLWFAAGCDTDPTGPVLGQYELSRTLDYEGTEHEVPAMVQIPHGDSVRVVSGALVLESGGVWRLEETVVHFSSAEPKTVELSESGEFRTAETEGERIVLEMCVNYPALDRACTAILEGRELYFGGGTYVR